MVDPGLAMRALIVLHRWLGVAFCLLFAMWFASGIVMHFVPYPAFTAADRLAGRAPLDLAAVGAGPAAALVAAHLDGVTRVRLLQWPDGPVYLVANGARSVALRAADLSQARIVSAEGALTVAKDYAARRHWDASAAAIAAIADADQWTLPGEYDHARPFYRIALGDAAGTELYVSAPTGEIALVTTRRQRAWNYAGSGAHWLYLTALRRHPAAWSRLVWWLSLLALVGASAGAVVGTLRLGGGGSGLASPYTGFKAAHHRLGVACMVFVLTWIFSGFLSMDDGLLFSTGRPSAAEAAAIAGAPDWSAVPGDEARHLDPQTVEAEWFAFGGRIWRRERDASDAQRLMLAGAAEAAMPPRAFISADTIDAVAPRLAQDCAPAVAVAKGDSYASLPSVAGAPVYRVVCGDDWYDIDASNGSLLEKLDSSRRAYRWLFGGLHKLDFPALAARPALRSTAVVGLCLLGFVFSLTGVVIAWRRIAPPLRRAARRLNRHPAD